MNYNMFLYRFVFLYLGISHPSYSMLLSLPRDSLLKIAEYVFIENNQILIIENATIDGYDFYSKNVREGIEKKTICKHWYNFLRNNFEQFPILWIKKINFKIDTFPCDFNVQLGSFSLKAPSEYNIVFTLKIINQSNINDNPYKRDLFLQCDYTILFEKNSKLKIIVDEIIQRKNLKDIFKCLKYYKKNGNSINLRLLDHFCIPRTKSIISNIKTLTEIKKKSDINDIEYENQKIKEVLYFLMKDCFFATLFFDIFDKMPDIILHRGYSIKDTFEIMPFMFSVPINIDVKIANPYEAFSKKIDDDLKKEIKDMNYQDGAKNDQDQQNINNTFPDSDSSKEKLDRIKNFLLLKAVNFLHFAIVTIFFYGIFKLNVLIFLVKCIDDGVKI